jgi:hypothetical protein
MIPLDLKYFDIEIYPRYLDVELLDVERIEAGGEDAMLGPLTDQIARLRAADLRLEACRDRQERIALRAAGEGRRRLPILRRRREAGLADSPC